ncbi:MAG TPA: BON domain-containing protein [Bryobacteraceae bacterium]|nr:BON domain-containing protein [Bryobacteraceae bacterium]
MRLLVTLVLGCAFLAGCKTNESPEAQVADMQIVAQVKTKLASDVGAATVTNVSVDSTNGVVTLAGQVDSSAIKAKVENVTKAVPKVVRVVDNIQVAAKVPAEANPKAATTS